jgi:hypothetical protein
VSEDSLTAPRTFSNGTDDGLGSLLKPVDREVQREKVCCSALRASDHAEQDDIRGDPSCVRERTDRAHPSSAGAPPSWPSARAALAWPRRHCEQGVARGEAGTVYGCSERIADRACRRGSDSRGLRGHDAVLHRRNKPPEIIRDPGLEQLPGDFICSVLPGQLVGRVRHQNVELAETHRVCGSAGLYGGDCALAD